MKKILTVILCLCMFASVLPFGAYAARTNADVVSLLQNELSLNESEWEVLRLCNIERAKEGLYSLTAIQSLQQSCDVRENEIATLFSHTRPDGSDCMSVISPSLNWNAAGENIAKGHRSPEEVVDGWMNSPGHKANILNEKFGYMGVGFRSDKNCWVQLFTSRSEIVDFELSTDKREFASKDEILGEYIMLKTSDGNKSYMPLDFDSMEENNGKYTLRLPIGNLPVFTIGSESSESSTRVYFADVRKDAFYAEHVAWAVENRITTGTSPMTFSPDVTCTRAQIITFLWRAVGSPHILAFNQYEDVSIFDYYYNAAVWACDMGMVNGSEFKADTPCTRAETVTYLWKNAGSPKVETTSNFTDVPETSSYAQAVAWAVKNGITSGVTDTLFAPEATCTRGQIVTFLHRAIG